VKHLGYLFRPFLCLHRLRGAIRGARLRRGRVKRIWGDGHSLVLCYPFLEMAESKRRMLLERRTVVDCPFQRSAKSGFHNELWNVLGLQTATYNGRAGRPLRTSPVPFLPKAGLELMLKEPLLMLVEFRKMFGSAVVSTRVGLPTLSNWRSFVFSRFHMALSSSSRSQRSYRIEGSRESSSRSDERMARRRKRARGR